MLPEQHTYYSPDNKLSGSTGKDFQGPQDRMIHIGGSDYLLSREMQMQCALVGVSGYESTRSILTIGEPHHNREAQFSLFRGLEIFFRDNPQLVKKTIFCAEGFPANEPISLQELIDAEPHPSDELIRETLNSFLITGYMAYEWKHQHGIPIIGTENRELYNLSREFATWYVKDPNSIFAEVLIEETETSGEIFVLTVEHGWTFAVDARNKFIASTLINAAHSYENPVLFMGQGHLVERQDELTFNILQRLAMAAVAKKVGIFGNYLKSVDPTILENHAIHYYLQESMIGYSVLEPLGLYSKREEMAYQRLFQAQSVGKSLDDTDVDYQGYLDWLLAKKIKPGKSTTVEPSPKAAAEFVRRLKEQQKKQQESGTIYEAPKTHDYEFDWFQESPTVVKTALQRDSLCTEKGINPRGHDFELVRKANLASTCPHIDDIVIDAMTATSMKSMDLTDKTYRNIQTVESTVKRYIDDLSGFTYGVWKDMIFERGRNFQDRYVELAIPVGRATQPQVEKLLELQEYAQSQDVTLVIVEVP